MKALLILGMATLSASMVTTALADAGPTGAKKPIKSDPYKSRDGASIAKDDCARARAAGRPCELTIEGETIDGAAPSADGSRFNALSWITSSSLLRIRRDFLPEIIKSAEDL